MSPINRVEVIGIFLSVVVMALVLVAFRFDSSKFAFDMPINRPAAGVITVNETDPNQQAALADAIVEAAPTAELQKMIIDDVVIGEGNPVQSGDTISVHYIGRLQNGQEFDNSYTRGTPFTFEVGAGRVIEGWDEGVVGMRAGGQRVLVIPAHMAYGETGAGPIPGGATLVFAIELLEIN